VGGELDIMEMVGGLHNSSVMGTYHWSESQCYHDDWDKLNANYPALNSSTFIDFSADYHVFSATWTPYAIQWFVDGVQYYERTVGEPWNLFIPNTPMYMILNTALSWCVPPPWWESCLRPSWARVCSHTLSLSVCPGCRGRRWSGPQPPFPNPAIYPVYHYIDYVRFYQPTATQ
jgi:beta-glucanase (GH16 family)